MALLPKTLMIVSLRISEDNPEIFDILKCYFEGILNITSICAFDLNDDGVSDKYYAYVRTDTLEHIFFKMNDDFYEYMQICIVSLQNVNTAPIDCFSYTYESWFNYHTVYVTKKLEQLGLILED